MLGRTFSTALTTAALIAAPASAANWIIESGTDNSGLWTDLNVAGVQAGWDGSVPNGAGQTAFAGFGSTASATTTLNQNVTLGKIEGDNRLSWTIEDDGNNRTITLDSTSGNAAIFKDARSHLTIDPALILADNLDVTRDGGENNGRGLTLNGNITGTGSINFTIDDLGFIDVNGSINSVGAIAVTGDTTGNQAVTLDGTIGSNVTSLTKNGDNVLSVRGSNNSYTGGTIVNGGTLGVTQDSGLGIGNVFVDYDAALALSGGTLMDYIDDEAILDLAYDGISDYATVNLNFVGTDVVKGLKLNGVSMPVGTYSSLTHSDYFVGTGMIEVVPEPSAIALVGLAVMPMLRRRRA